MALLSVLLLICVTATSYTFTHAKPVISQPKSTCSFSTQLWEGGEDVFGHAAGGACRYTVRYGQAARWVDSQLSFDVGNRTSSLPPSCPQPAGTYVVGSEQSEDCLYATIYTPKGMSPLSKLPIFVWIHGGSFYAGSASAPGLDGSKLASTGDIIVIVIQYRLGVLGYIPPSTAPSWADPNLGLRDIILGLQTINQYAALIGGDPNKVTVGGQSSGGSMIRALLGAPTAKSLFRAAIIQSDPMNYGFASPDITSQLRRAFYSQDQLKQCDSLKCLQQIPVATIVAAQNYLVASTPLTIQGVPLTMPIRPSYNNPTLTSDPTVDLFNIPASLSNDPSSIALLLSTVSNEAGSALQATFPAPVPLSNDTYFASLSMIVNPDRAKIITSSAQYALPSVNSSSEAGVYGQGGDMFRETYERAATDGIWRCPNRDVARAWSRAGGKVWVGEWTKGATYPTNQQSGGYCEQKGRVCHEDNLSDIRERAKSVSRYDFLYEILSYWTSFIKDLDPNGPSSSGPKRNYPNLTHLIDKAKNWWDDWSSSWKWWKRAASTDPPAAVTTWDQYRDDDDVLSLGGGEVSMCLEGFWGDTAKYDWQLYG